MRPGPAVGRPASRPAQAGPGRGRGGRARPFRWAGGLTGAALLASGPARPEASGPVTSGPPGPRRPVGHPRCGPGGTAPDPCDPTTSEVAHVPRRVRANPSRSPCRDHDRLRCDGHLRGARPALEPARPPPPGRRAGRGRRGRGGRREPRRVGGPDLGHAALRSLPRPDQPPPERRGPGRRAGRRPGPGGGDHTAARRGRVRGARRAALGDGPAVPGRRRPGVR